MTMLNEAFKEKLKEYHAEEMKDVEKYMHLAKLIDKNCPSVSAFIRDVADDEQSHAEIISYILSNY